jgi:hypothetical protein
MTTSAIDKISVTLKMRVETEFETKMKTNRFIENPLEFYVSM